jgi:hypothetical protein
VAGVHTAYVFSNGSVRVTKMASGEAQANAGRRGEKWDEDRCINEETKRTGGEMQIGMDELRLRQENKKGIWRSQIDHLFRAISRVALINGTSVHNGSAIEKNRCCKSCVASGRSSASTSSVFAR